MVAGFAGPGGRRAAGGGTGSAVREPQHLRHDARQRHHPHGHQGGLADGLPRHFCPAGEHHPDERQPGALSVRRRAGDVTRAHSIGYLPGEGVQSLHRAHPGCRSLALSGSVAECGT